MNYNTIQITDWNAETRCREATGEEISINKIARSMTEETFARLLEDFLNLGGKQFNEGQVIGQRLQRTHRTLQRQVVCFALGIIVGLSEQDYTDARNKTAIDTAKLLAQMVKEGKLPLGVYL